MRSVQTEHIFRGPPARVPYGKTIHRIVLPTLLRFATQEFRSLLAATGALPHVPASLLKKA